MIRILAIGLMALALAGCGSTFDSFPFMQRADKPIPRDVMPKSFKQEIVYVLPSAVADPKEIREAYYSDPVLDPKVNTYVSCVRFNARNAAGDYQGPKEYAAYYYGGHLNQFVAAPADQCRGVAYKPFPEIERLCPGGRCGSSS